MAPPVKPNEAKPGSCTEPADVQKPPEDWKQGKDLVQPTHPGKQTAAA